MTNVLKIDGYEIEVSNLNKVLFPKSGITKGDLINYYRDITSRALSLYKDRPLTMQRCPNGIQQQNFMQKEIPNYFPSWIDQKELSKKEGSVRHVLVNKKATFVYLANQACVTFHLGLSIIDKIDYPRYLLFDLDPSSEDLSLLKQVALYVQELNDSLGLTSFIQTTGSRGFHIYIPLKRELTFEQTHTFAKDVASHLAHKYPNEITIELSKEKRDARVFIDYVRNAYGLHAVGPYSIRTKENAPIATPLHWHELENKNLFSQSYTIKNIHKRLDKFDDPWKDILKTKNSLKLAQPLLIKLLNR
ncbi:MAG: non-homologous end-joining DNA ligase [Candidatus Nucleicultricaceae bacterium]